MDAEGHQIASHTWTHLDLSKIDKDDRKDQILNVEGALNNIVGKIPTYIRPPYSSCTVASGCEQDMQDLGYHVIYFDIDTDDYQQNPRNTFQNSLDWFKGNITKNDATPEKNEWLSISHDIIDKTANELTEFMLKTITDLGYKAVTVGECLGDPKDNWYRRFGDSADRVGANSTSTSVSSSFTSSQVQSSAACIVSYTNVAQTASSSSASGSSSSASPSSPDSPSSSPSGSSSTSGGAVPEQTTSAATSVLQNAEFAVSALLFSIAALAL